MLWTDLRLYLCSGIKFQYYHSNTVGPYSLTLPTKLRCSWFVCLYDSSNWHGSATTRRMFLVFTTLSDYNSATLTVHAVPFVFTCSRLISCLWRAEMVLSPHPWFLNRLSDDCMPIYGIYRALVVPHSRLDNVADHLIVYVKEIPY